MTVLFFILSSKTQLKIVMFPFEIDNNATISKGKVNEQTKIEVEKIEVQTIERYGQNEYIISFILYYVWIEQKKM